MSAERMTVLLVDDDIHVLRVHEYILLRLGVNVITATDGGEGIELFDKHKGCIGMVVTDYAMPRMNGYQMASMVRKRCKDVPIAICTGCVEDVEILDIKALEIRLLEKPVKVAEWKVLLYS